MERNKWETAIRCLEVALHPHTADEEVIAGVNGFRRTAEGAPLSEICREFAGGGRGAAAERQPPGRNALDREELDQLAQENRELRRRLASGEAEQLAALERLREAERRIRALSGEIHQAEQSFADFRSASAQIVEELSDENFDLRGALRQASQATVRPPSFREVLAGALGEAPATAAPQALHRRHPWIA